MLANNDIDTLTRLVTAVGEEYKLYLTKRNADLVETQRLLELEGNRARAELSSVISNVKAGEHFDADEILGPLDAYLTARIKQVLANHYTDSELRSR